MDHTQQSQSADRQERVNIHDHGNFEHETHVVEDLNAERRSTISRIAQFIWLLFGALEAVIGLRVILKLLAANPENPFAKMVYSFTDLFLWPFMGLTISPSVGNVVLEIPALVAIFVYALVAWVLVRFVWLFYKPTTRRVRTVEREDNSL